MNSKPSLHSRAPRRGQALILAVLVMLFAVLLSTAFLVVIGNTGRLIGRETDRAEASRNADKAVSFVVARVRAADNPDAWNPAQDVVLVDPGDAVPTPSSADYDLYYSPLDKAMGWASQGFVKYPDPRRSRQAPQFLVSSRVLGRNDGGVNDDAEGGDKRFMLRITIIGLSSKNPETWSRRTLYKTTNWNGATFSYANFVTSFDPDTQKSISSTIPPSVNGTAVTVNAAPPLNSNLTFPVYAAKGQGNERVAFSPRIAEVGNTLMISDGQNQPLVGVVKSSTLSNSIHSVTVRVLQAAPTTATPPTFAPNAKVALVGSLFETTQSIDDNGDGTTGTVEVATNVQGVSGVRTNINNTDQQPFGNGAQFNNGLNVPLTTTFGARIPEARTNTSAGQNALSSSGPVSFGDPTPIPANTPIGINFSVAVEQGTPLPTPTFVPQPVPNQNQFLRVAFDQSGTTQITTADSLVAPVIAPRSVRPAPIDFASYRNKAKASNSYSYINNPDDVEKFNGQPLTNSQLQRLWQRKSFAVAGGGNVTPVTLAAGTTGARLCYGRPGTDAYIYPMASGSLEQRGIRGWISPWEFLPRGAQLILNPANGVTPANITIISDPLSDNSSNAPDVSKAFNPAARDFSVRNVAPPANGIICAEGNLRVSGAWDGIPLTIVSNNNIYIEGSIDTSTTTTIAGVTTKVQHPERIALLAKKNVVLNPTQFVARPLGTVDTSVGKDAEVGTISGTGMMPPTTTITLNTSRFKVGDKVAVFSQTGALAERWRTVQNVDATTITLDNTPATAYTGTVKVKLACDPPIVLAKVDADATTDYFKGRDRAVLYGQPDNDAKITELPVNATTLAQADTFWAYAFKTGGDTLARNVPFGAPIGIAMRETVAKKNILFTVKGGDDSTIGTPDPTKDDNGERLLSIERISTLINYKLRPQPGTINGGISGDLQKFFDPDPSVNRLTAGDKESSMGAFERLLVEGINPPDDPKKTRWHIKDVSNPMTATVATRRLSNTDITFNNTDINAFPALNDTDKATEEALADGTIFRVPLTSSVVLFSGTLTTTTPNASALSRIGTTFGFQIAAVDTTTETRFIKAVDMAKAPAWDQPAASGTANSVKYTQSTLSNDIGWTRDGAGDYNDQLPAYYVSGWHFQKVVQDPSAPPGTTPTGTSVAPSTTNPIKSNMTVQVDATIYAEGGSWFVIPVPTPNANGAQPTDADQQIEWRRPAYAVTINGNIAQMMTPTATVDYDDEPDPDSVSTGAMKRWTDSLSYQVTDGTTIRWQTIRYQAAPLPAIDTSAMGINGYARLPQLPASTDILYTYSN